MSCYWTGLVYRERLFRLGRRHLGQNAIQYDVTESQSKAQTQSIVHLTQRRHATWHPYQRHVFCKTTGQLICLSAMYSCASLNWNGRHFVRSASLSRSSCYKSAKILEKFWCNKILAKKQSFHNCFSLPQHLYFKSQFFTCLKTLYYMHEQNQIWDQFAFAYLTYMLQLIITFYFRQFSFFLNLFQIH